MTQEGEGRTLLTAVERLLASDAELLTMLAEERRCGPGASTRIVSRFSNVSAIAGAIGGAPSIVPGWGLLGAVATTMAEMTYVLEDRGGNVLGVGCSPRTGHHEPRTSADRLPAGRGGNAGGVDGPRCSGGRGGHRIGKPCGTTRLGRSRSSCWTSSASWPLPRRRRCSAGSPCGPCRWLALSPGPASARCSPPGWGIGQSGDSGSGHDRERSAYVSRCFPRIFLRRCRNAPWPILSAFAAFVRLLPLFSRALSIASSVRPVGSGS